MSVCSRLFSLVVVAGVIAACTKESPTPETSGAAPAAPAASGVRLTGKIITVEMYTDGTGNYFKAKEIEAHRGDVIRFVLRSGVHNVHFLPDSNAGRTGLPPASEFLQLPDQTYDLTVALAPGHYYFQCDPHALLGMIARLEVEDE